MLAFSAPTSGFFTFPLNIDSGMKGILDLFTFRHKHKISSLFAARDLVFRTENTCESGGGDVALASVTLFKGEEKRLEKCYFSHFSLD